MTRQIALLLLSLLVPALAHGDKSSDMPASTVTLPLDRLLQLRQEVEQARKPSPKPPPLGGSVDKLELSGRLFDEGIELAAHFEVTILSEGNWLTLPLLRLEPGLSIAALPELEGAAVVKQGESLALVTQKAGSYRFDLSLWFEAQKDRHRRTVKLAYPGATLATMRIQFDENLFRMETSTGRREPEALVLYPKGNRFSVEWEQLGPIAAPAVAAKRPPVPPLIERAQASVVSTLEGRAILRLLYDFRCDRSQPIEIELHNRQQLEKVFLNGASIPVVAEDRTLRLNLEPARAGDQAGKLELVLAEPLDPYHLSGTLRFALPRARWPINEIYLQLHLPHVFQYRRVGGSMEQVESSPAVEFTQKIPTPGKELSFHQYLATSSTPEVQLAYDVELSGNYFH